VAADGRVLLGRRAHEPQIGVWEIPGGFVERGEHPTRAAVRELREELGVDVVLTGLIGTYLEPSSTGECLSITAYAARLVDPAAPVRPDPAEVSSWGWFRIDEVPSVLAGRDRERVDDWAAGRIVGLPGDGLS
jgi:ADP-ribose pyrophosphatase YjhB (NUDIX family)